MKRFFQRVAAFVAAFLNLSVGVTKAFFAIDGKDGLATGSVKVAVTVASRVIYVAADYWLSILSAVIVGAMKYAGYNYREIFLVIWAYDFVVATSLMAVSLKSKMDITLGESFRRAINFIHSKSKLAGYAMMVFLIGKAVIWDGPEQVSMFFRKELRTVPRMVWLQFFLTIFQAAFWSWVYSLGYDSVSGLISWL